RQDAVRLWRCRGDAGADDAEVFQGGVRGARGSQGAGARRLSRSPAGGYALMSGIIETLTAPSTIAYGVLLIVVFFALQISAAVMVYAERKVAALMQQRYGPYLVGPKGLLQPIADIVKLFFKEELKPKAADMILFTAAPIISVAAAFLAFAPVPFGAPTTLFGFL